MDGTLIAGVIAELLTFEILSVLFIGVLGGIIIGALPGLSATMAIALMIPVTFGMPPLAGITLLISIYAGTMFGGAVPSILLHTPGTPSSAATAIDGYQMTLKGQGGKALGIAAIASTFGGLFGAVALLFLAPPLAALSLHFSAPEFFLIALFGLTIIASVAGGSPLKAISAGVVGLLIGTIGIDIFSGFSRFTFGVAALESGVSLVPAMIGLFSLSQVLIQVGSDRSGGNPTVDKVLGKVLPTWRELKRISKSILSGSGIGLAVGVLPGAGGEIASWVGYNEARRFSKHKEAFGHGSPEGVAAPEAANNAITGGAMIPLLTLGVPANVATAVLLGGFLIQGLTPGRDLFTQQAVLTYSIIFAFLVANLLMGVLALLGARYFMLIAKVPKRVLAPIIIAFSVLGSYAINNSLFDVWVMVAFGLFGYLARKCGFHPAPIVLGMLLGPIAEQGLRQSLVLSQVAGQDLLGYFLARPTSLGLIGLILIALASPLLSKWLRRRSAPPTQPTA